MAAALLIGTNAWAISNFSELKTAIETAADGDTITLDAEINENLTSTTSPWYGIHIGTSKENGTAKYITLDLHGNDINITSSSTTQALVPFIITKGGLNVVNNGTKLAKITVTVGKTESGQGTNVFAVYGSYDYSKNPQDAKPFSHLQIGKNVMVTTTNGTVIAVDRYNGEGSVAEYRTTYFTSGYGYAFGARVDVEGTLISQGGTKCYGIKTNGNLAYPKDDNPGKKGEAKNSFDWTTADYAAHIKEDASVANVPYVHVHKGAVINSDPTIQKSAALYCSGYAHWLIEGTCDGNIGVSISSGDVDINDAKISSSAATHVAPTSAGSVSGAGSAIVMNSRTAYAGAMDVTVSGDTEVSAKAGFAIEESVNTTATIDPETQEEIKETKVENLTITGGSFQGGEDPTTHEAQPAIIVTSKTATDGEVLVYGGNVEGALVVDGDAGKTLDDFVPSNVHTTEVVIDGKKVTVISEGAEPTTYATVAGHAGESVKWTGATETLSTSIKLAELEINKMSGTPAAAVAQTLTIAEGVTLEVGRVIMGEKAQIIVEAGAKLIVNGEQGFVAPKASNFVLKASQDAQATFLFHPEVTSNRHPYATVEFVSKSWRLADGSAFAWQRFGIPSYGALTEITATAPTAFARFNDDTNEWESIGILGTMDYNQMATPFEYYQMLNNNPDMGTVVTMKGQLIGNDSPELAIRGNFWNGYANSYMAPISGPELLKLIPNTVDKAFYLNKITGDQATWESVTAMNAMMNLMDNIKPMQPFLLHNSKEAANVVVDYADAVYYTPAGSGETKPGAAPAPARYHSTDNVTFAKISVRGIDGVDRILVAEGNDFSAEFDNGYDAVKYMNEGINMYVSADEKMSNFATDNLENTYVGLQTVNGGNYTIEIANVQGEELTLIDHETGARVAMVEGATYEFTAGENTVNDYRFEIVGRQNMPTAIGNTEAVKSVKGVYTITGQYVGEMNVWNTLPAGVYVVNGEKRVK